MLTFDDGYRSHFERVLPLLKAFNYPALFALVGKWMELPDGGTVPYRQWPIPAVRSPGWAQLKEMAASPLVEFASHSFDYHRGLLANPQGNLIQAYIARVYDPASGQYESEAQRLARIQDDLARSRAWMVQRLGKAPRALVWPFGRYNDAAIAAAHQAGFKVMLNLDSGPNTDQTPLDRMHRTLLVGNPDGKALSAEFKPLRIRPLHAMQVDLDYVYDPDPAQQERNLDDLVEQALDSGASAVFLQAFADPEGDGVAKALYFPNRNLPMRADLFSRAAWQLHTRAGVAVFAWLPVLSFALPASHPASKDFVQSLHPQPGTNHRLTPFSEPARRAIAEIYEDLATHCTFEGLFFHDDASLSEDEDASPFGVQALAKLKGGRSAYLEKALTDFTLELAARVRAWQPALRTARNLYAQVVLDPQGPQRFAQSLGGFLSSYDYAAIMAFPFMEGADNPVTWLDGLVAKVKAAGPEAMARTVFELQTKDWNTGKLVESSLLARQLERLKSLGAVNLAFYPDDFLHNHPDLEAIGPWFSLRWTPVAAVGH